MGKRKSRARLSDLATTTTISSRIISVIWTSILQFSNVRYWKVYFNYLQPNLTSTHYILLFCLVFTFFLLSSSDFLSGTLHEHCPIMAFVKHLISHWTSSAAVQPLEGYAAKSSHHLLSFPQVHCSSMSLFKRVPQLGTTLHKEVFTNNGKPPDFQLQSFSPQSSHIIWKAMAIRLWD